MNSFIKSAIIILGILISGNAIYAQSDFQNIRKLKVEMVLQEMNLSKETEQKFLPLYNTYSDEVLALKRKIKELDKSNIDAQTKINKRQQYKEDILNVEKRYKEKFLKIITPQQLEEMHKGEDEFRKVLLEKRNRK